MARTAGSSNTEYAVWKGEEFITLGTAPEIAKELNIKINSIYWIANRCKKGLFGKEHMYIMKIEEGDEE